MITKEEYETIKAKIEGGTVYQDDALKLCEWIESWSFWAERIMSEKRKVTREKLEYLLSQIRGDNTIEVNRVGNLLVRNSEGFPVGYIDMFDEEYNLFDDLEEE